MEFVKKNGMYEAEFKVTADFNLHIERETAGDIRIMQKTVENGKYDDIKRLYVPAGDLVIDYDFAGLVYPKYIKVVSESEVTMGVVTYAE